MSRIMNIDLSRLVQKTQQYSLENPVGAALAAVTIVGSAWWLFSGKRKLKIIPNQNIVVITGCDSGFGLMTCKKLSAEGYLVVAVCLQAQSVIDLNTTVALAVQCDITKEAELRQLVVAVEELVQLKNVRLWAVVNNAGIANSGNTDLVSMDSCRRVMEVNFFAVFEVTRAFLPLLKQTKNSRVINISSAAGLTGSYQMGVYCASKHAVEGFGKVLRQELAPWNIHVAHINPGFMNTPILQSAFDASLRDLDTAPQDVVAQYDLSAVNRLKEIIDRLKDDPVKVVNKIIENVTLAKPAFNNPVGNGVYSMWCALCFSPQAWQWGFMEWANRQQGFGPTDTALARIQKY